MLEKEGNNESTEAKGSVIEFSRIVGEDNPR